MGFCRGDGDEGEKVGDVYITTNSILTPGRDDYYLVSLQPLDLEL